MKIGIVRYPGSNCDFDALRYFDESFFIWHKETNIDVLDGLDILVIPGGFAFGDRIYDKATSDYKISPGTMAVGSPVSAIILEAVTRSIPILGICNGFQILIQLGLLPGELLLNENGKFTCEQVGCEIAEHKFTTKLYIANSYGKYNISDEECNKLENNNQIFLKYSNHIPEIGSLRNIAGVCNENKKVFGMMPHPERNNYELKDILYKLMLPVEHPIHTQLHFQKSITELLYSEHISYKTTRRYLKKLFTKAEWVIQGPGENAGIVDIGDGYCIALRIESHNHPTFINPYEGAATGVGGIMRDIFTMGARPIAILDFLRFGTDDNNERLLNETIRGISYYGNCVGVPNIGGDLYRSKSYDKNPLVNIACIGILKKENIVYGNATNLNSSLIYVGSKTGNEGINGAAMASKSFTNIDVDAMQHNIQKSDPFLEKLLLEACCEISEKQLVEGMQDMGAGGLLCASFEVILRGRKKTKKNMGCCINLDKVPTKYKMEPCNILISESQERMLIVCKPEKRQEIFGIFKKWDLEYGEIGIVNNTGNYQIYHEGRVLYNNMMSNLNEVNDYTYEKTSEENRAEKSEEHVKKIHEPNRWKVYDSTVGNRTLKGPDKPGSYAILDIPENNKQLFVTWGETFEECHKQMTIFEGVKPLCVVNCLNFGHPSDSMNDFSDTIDSLVDGCTSNNIPVVGGNVSLYNSTDGKSIRPTPVLLMMGISV